MRGNAGAAYGHSLDGMPCLRNARKRWAFLSDGLVRRTSKTQQARPIVRIPETQFCRHALSAYGVARPFGRTPPGLISDGLNPAPRR